MTDLSGAARIASAQSSLDQALTLWDAADLHKIKTCNQLLEACAAELRTLPETLDAGRSGHSQEIRAAVMHLRSRIGRFTRIVDASSAFARGLSIYSGTTSSSYDATGKAIELGGG